MTLAKSYGIISALAVTYDPDSSTFVWLFTSGVVGGSCKAF